VPRTRNVMVLRGLTPELANQLDNRIDGRVDARFGRLREATSGSVRYSLTSAIGTPPTPNPWSLDETQTRGGRPDDQAQTMIAYLKMNQ